MPSFFDSMPPTMKGEEPELAEFKLKYEVEGKINKN